MSPRETQGLAREDPTARGSSRHVLLVDDDPIQLKLMRAHLVAAGFSVSSASGASEALEAARQQRPDAIMSDVRMSELDGFMLCSVFRSDPQLGTVPIMLVTAYFEGDDDNKLALSAGALRLVERSPNFQKELDALFDVLDSSGSAAVAAQAWRPEPYVRRMAHQMARLVAELTVRNRELQRVVNDLKTAKEAHLQLAAIVESSDDAIIANRTDGIITSWNAGAERLYGYRSDEAVGHHIELIVPEAQRRDLTAIFDSVERREGAQHFETVRRRKDRSVVDVSVTISALSDSKGDVIGASSIARDITQRKRAERALRHSEVRFRQLADAMPQIVWTANGDGCLDYYNLRWYEFTGFVKGETGDTSWRPILHPDDEQRTMDQWYGSVRTGDDYTIEHRFKDCRTGAYRWFLGRALPVRNAEGAIEKWFGTSTDIDDQKRLQGALEIAKGEAEHASRMKDQFLMTLSHELRTPLNVIYGRTQMLRNNSVIDREKALDTIEQHAKLQIRLVDDLLDLSQMITGQLRVDRCLVSVQSIIESAVAAIQPAADAKGVTLSASSADGLTVSADPGRVHQILSNLLTNAVKFTPRDGRVEVVAAPNELGVSIVVRDTGIGMPQEFLPHAFDRFRQADPATTRSHGGMGLGLAIVRHLTELHGGSVLVTSELGKGSSFVVVFPAAVGDDSISDSDGPSLSLTNGQTSPTFES
jgi:PAS domain S-box-containing protein